MPSTTALTGELARIHRHEEDHGFCLVCGGVWPCWRAARSASARPLPPAARTA